MYDTHSSKAVFKRSKCLFSQHLKGTKRVAFQAQTASRMGIVITRYIQHALATLLSELCRENTKFRQDTTISSLSFAIPTKVLDQFERSGVYDQLIQRKATTVDIGLDTVKDLSRKSDFYL